MVSENVEKVYCKAVFDDNFRKKWINNFENQDDENEIADVLRKFKA